MVVIVDYGMGNLNSVRKALEVLGADAVISNKKSDLENADRIILPGVGAFGQGMKNLKELGLIDALKKEVLEKKKPFLGLCLGMQLIAKNSTELGFNDGLGWLDAEVRSLAEKSRTIKIPHIGWNEITFKPESPLFIGFQNKPAFYFVHSYHVICNSESDVAATCDYGLTFTAAINKDNIFGTQFHPEKSQTVGLQVLKNFLDWKR